MLPGYSLVAPIGHKSIIPASRTANIWWYSTTATDPAVTSRFAIRHLFILNKLPRKTERGYSIADSCLVPKKKTLHAYLDSASDPIFVAAEAESVQYVTHKVVMIWIPRFLTSPTVAIISHYIDFPHPSLSHSPAQHLISPATLFACQPLHRPPVNRDCTVLSLYPFTSSAIHPSRRIWVVLSHA